MVVGTSGRTIGWLVLLGVFLAGPAMAREDYPTTDEECTNDHGKMVGKKDRAAIRSMCKRASKDGVHMMVVTVRSLEDYGARITRLDGFVDDLFDDWDIEYDALNDAILLFVSRKERQIRVRMGDAYGDKAWSKVQNIMKRTVGPNLGRRASTGIRKGFARLYDEVAKPSIRKRKKEDAARKRKQGHVNFE